MRVERGTALAGLAFVAATLGNVVTESAGPDITKSAAIVAAKISSDRGDLLANSTLHIVQGISVILFAAGLATLLWQRSRQASYVVFGSGAVTATAAVISAVLSATVASSIRHVNDSQSAYLLYRGARTSDIVSTIFFGAATAGMVSGLQRAGLLSRVMARIGWTAAAVVLAGGLAFLAPESGPFSPVEALGGTLVLVYVVLVSVRLLRITAVAEPDPDGRAMSPRPATA